MNEKLELKHLAPYLPYGLRVNLYTYSDILRHENFKVFVDEWAIEFKENLNVKKGKDFRIIDNNRRIYSMCSGHIKPILRPLSDLTDDEMKEFYYQEVTQLGNALFNEELSIGAFNLLLKMNVDVFGLIEKGLAIDINTIKP